MSKPKDNPKLQVAIAEIDDVLDRHRMGVNTETCLACIKVIVDKYRQGMVGD